MGSNAEQNTKLAITRNMGMEVVRKAAARFYITASTIQEPPRIDNMRMQTGVQATLQMSFWRDTMHALVWMPNAVYKQGIISVKVSPYLIFNKHISILFFCFFVVFFFSAESSFLAHLCLVSCISSCHPRSVIVVAIIKSAQFPNCLNCHFMFTLEVSNYMNSLVSVEGMSSLISSWVKRIKFCFVAKHRCHHSLCFGMAYDDVLTKVKVD